MLADDPIEIEYRAERLRVAIRMFGTVREHPHACMDASYQLRQEGRPLFDERDSRYWYSQDHEDRHLANACLALEKQVREEEFAAMERLLAEIPLGGEYSWVINLPWPRAYLALADLCEVGWFHSWDEYLAEDEV